MPQFAAKADRTPARNSSPHSGLMKKAAAPAANAFQRTIRSSFAVNEPFYLPTCRREKAAGRFQHRRVIVEQPDRGSRFSHQSLTKPGAHRRRRSSGIVNYRAFLVRSLRGIIPPASATSTPLAINRSAASAGFFPYKPVSTSADK